MKKRSVKRILTLSLTGILTLGTAMPAFAYAGRPAGLAAKAVRRGSAGGEGKISTAGSMYYAESYEALFRRLKAIKEEEYFIYDDYGVYEEEALEDSYVMNDSSPVESYTSSQSAKESSPTSPIYAAESTYDATGAESGIAGADTGFTSEDYSNTNLRDAAVDEADIVKTDGRYIYMIVDQSDLIIAKAEGMDLQLLNRTKIGEGKNDFTRNIQDFYLDKDRLYVISSDSGREMTEKGYYSSIENYTSLYTYDITERENPVLMAAAWQDGYYLESRRKDGCIYLFSSWYPSVYDTMEESSFIPRCNGEDIPAESFCIPESASSRNYLITGAVKADAPDSFSDIDVFVSGADNFYVSPSSIYVMNVDWRNADKTEITRFSYLDGEVEGIADVYIKGEVNDSFSLDEYQGNLRVLVNYFGFYGDGILSDFIADITDQSWIRRNALVILDENLQVISTLTGIARDEEIRSARFMGDTAYFVTFRNTDPLFSVDLSDPASPVILGELKVSGFSSYLHPYGENRMLGFGYEADEEYGRTTGLKLSLFDVSDKADVRELSRNVINGITYCPAMNDYKLILADAGRNVIGFYCENRYFIYKVENDEILREKIIDMLEYDLYSDYYGNETKGLYIADTLYICGNAYILPVNLVTLETGTALTF